MRLRKLVIAVFVAAIAAFGVVATAGGDPGNGNGLDLSDPQNTNIPFVGWVGQSLKVGKCVPYDIHGDRTPGGVLDQATADSLNLEIKATFSAPGSLLMEDWSGDTNFWPQWQVGGDPRLATVPVQLTEKGLCYAGVMTSAKPGLVVWKLSVEHELLLDIFLFLRGEGISFGIGVEDLALYSDIVLEHQGLAIFMQAGAVAAKEVPETYPGESALVGDPLGDGKFTPPYECGEVDPDAAADAADGDAGTAGFEDYLHKNLRCVFGLVKINVTGTFPLGNNFSGLINGDVVTLPTDWEALAKAMATDKDHSVPGSAYYRWDIHDDQLPTEGHYGNICEDTAGPIDAVDNCTGGDDEEFSNIFGLSHSRLPFDGELADGTVGPFDPVWASATLLSDGKVDAGDAPMPSLPVSVSLGALDIGALDEVEKEDIYVRDFTVNEEEPHNLYAPYYESLIPADTAGFPFGLGTYQATTNNFPGYIEKGVYEFWNVYEKTYRKGQNACKDVLGNYVPTPTGKNSVEVYTDEHGEAWVKFYPYRGLFLDPDLNGLCDVYTTGRAAKGVGPDGPVNGTPGIYGTATITAQPAYPGQPVFTPSFKWGNASVDKVAYHLADKALICLPKAQNVAYCVETVTDYNGDPIEGVKVKFTTSGDAANMVPASIEYNDYYDTRGQSVVQSGGDENFVVVRTNGRGQAGIEIVHSQNVCIDVTAENWYTRNGGFGILRFFEFNPHTGTACGEKPVTPPPPPTTTTDGGNGSNGGSSGNGSSGGSTASSGGSESTVVSLGGPVIEAKPVLTGGKTATIVKANARLFSVKVIQNQLGRFLIVNVKANKKALLKKNVLFKVKKRVALKKNGKFVKRNGKVVKVWKTVKVWKKVPAATVKIQILNKKGKVIKTVTRRVAVNKAFKIQNLKLPKAAASVRTSVIA